MATWRSNRMNLPRQREQNSRWRPHNGNQVDFRLPRSFPVSLDRLAAELVPREPLSAGFEQSDLPR
jgi:hypothetical protein